MRKIALAIFSISIITSSIAQNNLKKVSSDAYLVFDVDGSKLLDKVSEKDLEETFMFSEITKRLSRNNVTVTSISDMGVDLSGEFTIVGEDQNEMSYNYTLYPVKDVKKLTDYVEASSNSFDTILNKSGYRLYKYRYGTSHLAIGGKQAVYIYANYKGYEYDFYLGNYYDYGKQREAKNEVMNLYAKTKDFNVALKKAEDLANKLEKDREAARQEEVKRRKALENMTEAEIKQKELDEASEALSKSMSEMAEAIEAQDSYNKPEEELPADYYEREREISDFFYKKKDEARKKLEDKREAYIASVIDSKISQLLSKKSVKNSISSVNSFKKNRDSKAVAYFWTATSDISPMLNEIYGRGYGRRSFRRNSFNTLEGEEYGTSSNLYLDDTRAYAQMKVTYGQDLKGSMDKIFKKDFNKKLMPFLNKEAIGFGIFSINSQALFEEMPKFYGKAMKESFKRYRSYGRTENYDQEIDLAVDFFQIFMDEEDMAELFKGDAVFTLNDLKMKDVEYTSYEYDENNNYKRTEVTKTRKEPIPSFNFAITSNKQDMIEKIFKYGAGKDVLKKQGNYFAVDTKRGKLPFDLFMTYKDGVLLLTTDKKEMNRFNSNQLKSNISSETVSMLNNNASMVYYNNKRMFELLPKDEIARSERDKKTFDYIKNNTQDGFFTQKVVDGDFITELSVNVPEGEKNSAKYLLKMFDKVIELQAR